MKKLLIVCVLAAVGGYVLLKDTPEIKNLNNPGQTIVAFGDSLTAGYGAPKGSSYPDFLARKLGRDVVNLGLTGETAVHAPSRLPEVLAQKPYMVLIEFGANDHLRGMSQAAAVSAVGKIVDAVQQAGAVAVVVDTGGPGMDKYTRDYKQLAREKGAVFVPGILKGIFYKPKYKSDRVHPNADGYEIVAKRVYQKIKPYVK